MVMSLMSNPKGAVATIIVSQAGDGDTTDIQTGINMLPTTGGSVYIKEGTYTITSKINLNKDNIMIIGAGWSTIISTSSNITMMDILNDKCLVQGISFSGTGSGNSSNIGINVSGTRITISDCLIENTGSHGIAVSNNNDLSIFGVRIYSPQADGMFLSNSHNSRIINCIVYNILDGNAAIDIDSSDNIIVEGNHLNTIEILAYGIQLNAVEGSVISGNIISGANGREGIEIVNSDYNVIMGNFGQGRSAGGFVYVSIEGTSTGDVVIGNLGSGSGGMTIQGSNHEIGHNINFSTETPYHIFT